MNIEINFHWKNIIAFFGFLLVIFGLYQFYLVAIGQAELTSEIILSVMVGATAMQGVIK